MKRYKRTAGRSQRRFKKEKLMELETAAIYKAAVFLLQNVR